LQIFFNEANFPIPKGFSLEEDVNLKAPRTNSDDYIVYYLEVMSIYGVTTYSLAVSACGRDDIRNYFIECSRNASDLLNKVISLSKARGQYSDAPMIPPPEHVEFMEKRESFLICLED
jgi:hypothetical protein